MVVVTMVTAAFSTGCLSAQAGSRFSTSPISNFQYNPERKDCPISQMWISRFKSGKWLFQRQNPNGTVSYSNGSLFTALGG